MSLEIYPPTHTRKFSSPVPSPVGITLNMNEVHNAGESHYRPSSPLPPKSTISESMAELSSDSDHSDHSIGSSGTPDSKTDVSDSGSEGLSAEDIEKQKIIITEPYTYLASKPGKDIRKLVLHAFNEWLKVPPKALEVINNSIAMLHNASLLIDDIEDNSTLRRGEPVAHVLFGVPQALNSANYMYFEAQQHLKELRDWPAAFEIFNEELLNLHRGQGMEIYWRENLACPTVEEYVEMAGNKTGGLFRLAARLMMLASDTNIDILEIANSLGIMFQIADDLKNLVSDKMSASKGNFAEDLSEGNFSFPIIHAIKNSAHGNNEIKNILRMKTKDVSMKMHAVSYMRDVTHSFAYTEMRLREFHSNTIRAMKEVNVPNTAMDAILEMVAVC